MKFNKMVFFITEDCNFNCSYCRQKKEKKVMRLSTIESAVPFFYPFLEEQTTVIFYGGEPLLAFDVLQHAVSLFLELEKTGKKRLKFSLTTNGSLLTDEILDFFNRHRFYLLLSFDGGGQDMNRKPGSLEITKEIIARFRGNAYPDIEFATNSVFTPGTVGGLAESLRMIVESDVRDIQFSLDTTVPWDETALSALERQMEQLRDFLVSHYKKTKTIPLSYFQKPDGTLKPQPKNNVFTCAGGNDRITISPDEDVWACLHFHTYLMDKHGSDEYKTYSLGKLEDFKKNHETIFPRWLENSGDLRQDFFFTENRFCFLCEEVEQCSICPLYAAYATSCIGKIPSWMCHTQRIPRKAKEHFLKIIEGIDSRQIELEPKNDSTGGNHESFKISKR